MNNKRILASFVILALAIAACSQGPSASVPITNA
jgi:hypothetical protein